MANTLRNSLKTGLFTALCCMAIGSAKAQIVPGGLLYVASTGNVVATYRGSTAGYNNLLFLDTPSNALGQLFDNRASNVGDTVNLGSFAAGTELIFRMHVNDTNEDFISGPASRNTSNNIHARVDYGYSPSEVLVEFEDLTNGPFDFNDLGFSLSNVSANNVPEPGTVALLAGLSIPGLLLLRRRK